MQALFHLQSIFFYFTILTMNFKQELETYLKSKQLKQMELAKQAGISQSILSLFLSGKRGLTLKTVEKLKKVME
jgi:predicted transcriptional regulator